jgi:hypothetical protein
LDERSSAQLLGVLRDHAEGIAKLQALLKRDALDVAIIRQELGAEDGLMGGGGAVGGGNPGGLLGGGGSMTGAQRGSSVLLLQ